MLLINNFRIYTLRHFTRFIFLIIFALMLYILYSFIPLLGGIWFMHPDERDVYSLSLNYFHTGRFYKIEPLNIQFKELFTPEGSKAISDRIVPGRSLGLFILLTPYYILGEAAPFFIIPIIGLLLVIISFLLIRKLFDSKIAFYASIFFSLSPNVIYWNNMLYSNIPALMFFLISIYFFIVKDKKIISCLVGYFFSQAIWLRYEYLIFVVLYLSVSLILDRSKKNLIKTLIVILTTLIFLIPILFVNKELYGNFFSMGYTQDTYDVYNKVNFEYGVKEKNSFIETLSKYIYRLGGQFLDPKIGIYFVTNLQKFIFDFIPITLTLGICGILLIKRNLKFNNHVCNLFILGIFMILYFGSSGGYYGYGRGWITDSYSRYFLLPFFVLCIGFAALVIELIKRGSYLIVAFAITASLLHSIHFTFYSPRGLIDTLQIKKENKLINDYINTLPLNSIIISNEYSKAILSRPVLVTYLTKSSSLEETNNLILSNTATLLANNPVFLLENEHNPLTYTNLYGSFNQDKRFTVQKIPFKYNFYELKLNY